MENSVENFSDTQYGDDLVKNDIVWSKMWKVGVAAMYSGVVMMGVITIYVIAKYLFSDQDISSIDRKLSGLALLVAFSGMVVVIICGVFRNRKL